MKKLTALLLAMLVMISVTACGSEEPAQEKAQEKSPEAAYVGTWQEEVPDIYKDDKAVETIILFEDGTGEEFWSDDETGTRISSWYLYDGTIYINKTSSDGGETAYEYKIEGENLVYYTTIFDKEEGVHKPYKEIYKKVK